MSKYINNTFSRVHINESGFTLLEVLIALTIFSVGLLGIAGMQITAIKTNSSSNTRSVQTDVAASVLEEILTWPDSSFSDTTNATWTFNAGDDTVLSGGTYRATYTLDVDYSGINNLIFVEVTVQQINGFQRIYKATGYKRGT
jgi:type IV pilus assembly protein PilV